MKTIILKSRWNKWKYRILENGLFWMALVLLSIGAGTTLYHKAVTGKETVQTGTLLSEEIDNISNQLQKIIITFYP